MCKECHEYTEYKSFDELPQELKDKYKGRETNQCKNAYINFINKLNKNGDELVSDYINATTKVRIYYSKCGHTHPEGEGTTPHSYKKASGCSICRGYIVIKGINDLATTHPQYVKYFVNIKDAYTHTYASHDKVKMKCPICGAIKVIGISTLIFQGFGCSKCGDGISYPEKLMALVLKKLDVEFTRQLPYDNGKYKYDFYIDSWKVIYETHGIQHYEGWCRDKDDLLRQEATDKNKRYSAIYSLKIRNEDYHEINCRYSTLEWCRPNIEEALSKYIDISILTNEDWEEFDKQAQKSLKIEVCRYWEEQKVVNKDLTTTIMAEMFKVNEHTIVNWLTWGNEKGMCVYNGKDEFEARIKRVSKFIYLIKPDGTKWYGEAMSQNKLARLTGIGVNTIGLCRRNGKPLDGKGAKYDSKYIGSYIIEAK